MKKRKIIKALIDYILFTLNEIAEMPHLTEFAEGEIIAYVECLEFISKWNCLKKFNACDIENKYPIR